MKRAIYSRRRAPYSVKRALYATTRDAYRAENSSICNDKRKELYIQGEETYIR